MIFKHGDTLKVQQEDVPKPKAGEVLIHVRRCGCCHIDIHAIYGDWPNDIFLRNKWSNYSNLPLSRLPLCPGISYVSVIYS
jgi:NADPH:quinone reductase-like Zn-dependent oxidoreductase